MAEFLGESNRKATRDLGERRASLARTEQRIAALIRLLADGDNSEYVVTALRDLHAQARTERAAIAALEARGATPIALPTPAEVAERALGLERLFEGNPIEVREALLRYFVDGRIVGSRGLLCGGGAVPAARRSHRFDARLGARLGVPSIAVL